MTAKIQAPRRWLLAALLSLCALPLHADMAGAAAAYKAGAAKMKLKDYAGAITDFSASLAAEPRYIYSYRERGTAKYYAGDKAGALADYRAYAKAKPSDAKVAALVKKLEAQGMQPAAAPALKPDLGRPKWGLSLGGGYNTYAMSDYNKMFSNQGPGVSGGTINSGFGFGLGVNWRVLPMAIVVLDLDYLMASATETGTTFKNDYNAPALAVGLGGQYVMGFGSLDLRLGLGVGYLTLMGAGLTLGGGSGSSTTVSLSGSGFDVKALAGVDYFITRSFAVGLDLGYRMANISPVTFTTSNGASGTWQSYDASSGTFKNLGLDYSGLLSKLSLSYWF